MRIILTIISTGILALVPAYSEPLGRCPEPSVVPKGSSSDGAKRDREPWDKIGVKNVEEKDPQSRSPAAESTENEPLVRRYIPHKLGSKGVKWYRRKADDEDRLRAMEDEESEDRVLPPEPDSLIPEESADGSATVARDWHVDKIPPGVEILGERKPIEVEESETDPADLEAQTRQRKGKKKKKRPSKKRPRPTATGSSNFRGLERQVGDEDDDQAATDPLGENLNDVAVAKIVQQILGLERAYGKRYTDGDFGQVKTPVRYRPRPSDLEPIYLM